MKGKQKHAATIKPGFVVQLKSGGPKMTVCESEDSELLTCRWFCEENGASGAQEDTFSESELKVVIANP